MPMMGSKSDMIGPRVIDYDPPEFTLQKLREDIRDMRAHVMCQICIRPMYEPYTISCGHTFCYSCLAQWFATHRRFPSCPECRATVVHIPAPAYVLRDIVQMFISRETLLQDSETLVEHHEHMETEARTVEADRSNNDPRNGGLFRGIFKPQPQILGAIIDHEDGGITRCPHCAWELEGGFCNHCGIPVYEEPAWSDDDGSLSNASESLADIRMEAYPSDYDSVDSDEVREFAATMPGHRNGRGPRARLGRAVRRVNREIRRPIGNVPAARWRGEGNGFDHLHDSRNQDDRDSDQDSSSVGSTIATSEYDSAIGEIAESNVNSYSGNESVASSMEDFLDDDSRPFNREEAFPANYNFWPAGTSSDGESSHDVSHLQNDWSDTHDDDGQTENGEPTLDHTNGDASSTGFSSPDRTHHCGTIPLGPTTGLLEQTPPSARGAGSSRQPHLQEAAAVASNSEDSEASLPPLSQRNRKRRHVVEDDSSNDISASDLDTRRPRKRKSSSQDTTTVGHLSPGPPAQDQPVRSLGPTVGSQPSPILIDSSPARPISPSLARRRHCADRPRIASYPRSAIDRVGNERPSRSGGGSSGNILSTSDGQSDAYSDDRRSMFPLGQPHLGQGRAKAAVRTRPSVGLEIRL